MGRLLKILTALALATLLFAALLFYNAAPTGDHADTIIWAQPHLADIYVHGEHAQFELKPGFGQDVLLLKGDSPVGCPAVTLANKGLYLPSLESGLYRVYAQDLSVLAPESFELAGYTVTRGGKNLQYRFASEEGRLTLRVAAVSVLPAEVYDIIIDAGHGGSNSGASVKGYEEKNEVLQASLYMAELFGAAGLKVALTRMGDYIPGQPDVAESDIDPYVSGGRVDLVYQKQAKYFISNHLNASPRAAFQGFQLYRSVQAGDAWQQEVSASLLAYGHEANDDFPSFGLPGRYRRYSQDDPATGSDYYYILRETGGHLTGPRRFAEAHSQLDLRQGAEGLLVEYLFLDNFSDREYWLENWQGLVEAVVEGCLGYWGIK